MPVRHNFVNPIADEPGFAGTKPSHWNDDHDLSGLVAADIIDFDDAVAASAVPSDFQPPIVDGNYYLPMGLKVDGINATADSDLLRAVPIWFSHTQTWARIGVYSQGAGSVNDIIRLGIWASGTDNLPDTVLVDSGEISLESDGEHEATISATLQANTLYWLGSLGTFENEISLLSCVSAGDIPWLLGTATPPWNADGLGSHVGLMNSVIKSQSYGALPTFGAIDRFSGQNSIPAIWLRKV